MIMRSMLFVLLCSLASIHRAHIRSLCGRCTVAVPSLYRRCAVAVPSLYRRGTYRRCAVAVPSLCGHCTVAVRSLYRRCTVAVRSVGWQHCVFWLLSVEGDVGLASNRDARLRDLFSVGTCSSRRRPREPMSTSVQVALPGQVCVNGPLRRRRPLTTSAAPSMVAEPFASATVEGAPQTSLRLWL
jgi:hypothetical protein